MAQRTLRELLEQPYQNLPEFGEAQELERISQALVFPDTEIVRSEKLYQLPDVTVGVLTTHPAVMNQLSQVKDLLRQEPTREHLFRFQVSEYRQTHKTHLFLCELVWQQTGNMGSVSAKDVQYAPGEGEVHTHPQFLPEYWDALSPGDVIEMLSLPPWREPSGLIRMDKRVAGVLSVRSASDVRLQLYELNVARALTLLDRRHDSHVWAEEFVYRVGGAVRV